METMLQQFLHAGTDGIPVEPIKHQSAMDEAPRLCTRQSGWRNDNDREDFGTGCPDFADRHLHEDLEIRVDLGKSFVYEVRAPERLDFELMMVAGLPNGSSFRSAPTAPRRGLCTCNRACRKLLGG